MAKPPINAAAPNEAGVFFTSTNEGSARTCRGGITCEYSSEHRSHISVLFQDTEEWETAEMHKTDLKAEDDARQQEC